MGNGLNSNFRILAIGDSHGVGFDDIASIRNCVYLAASIKGLPKRMSALNIREQVFQEVKKNDFDYLVFKFGQVDIEFGYWHTVIANGHLSLEDFFTEVISSFESFLDDVAAMVARERIIIFGVNLPSIFDTEEAMINCAKIINGDNIDIFQESVGSTDQLVVNVALDRRGGSLIAGMGVQCGGVSAEGNDQGFLGQAGLGDEKNRRKKGEDETEEAVLFHLSLLCG